ncbi:YheC/YheD family endospore coat-associated protein [Cytobacillus dafuensis]|uniref:YheC/YheD family protein n=1 Tax=Cytobacillus dafuensis TaxID=1742359 RepID=A0A5B8YZW8_CYTDA|nr:YheC/YheD family protein [Cytobacillus dafuensis]QED46225.1 YheC/YheD family protein [Cytobacillus dafuensis]
MVLIGMLHYKKRPDDVKIAYACAAVAKMEGFHFFYFSYQCVQFDSQKINGWIYEKGNWIQKEMDFPNVIINNSSPKSIKQKEIYSRLKKMIPFTSHTVGNKMKVYKKILRDGEFADYLIPTFPLESTEKTIELLEKAKTIVIKPYSGNHGKKVIFIQGDALKGFTIINGDHKDLLDSKSFDLLIEELKHEQKYLTQPFIECKTKTGLTYDFRLHVQKNGSGNWDINLIYPRISGSAKLISNISSGGYRGDLDRFLKDEFGNEYFNKQRLLEKFAIAFASHFESLYNHSFDELGIDVGMDENGKIWIFEVNWRPGSKHREFDVAKRIVHYAHYMAKDKG